MNTDARKALLTRALTPRTKPLRLVNSNIGLGWQLFGRWRDPKTLGEGYLKMLWLRLFFVPVIPLSVYLLEKRGGEVVLGRLSLRNFGAMYPRRHVLFYFSSFIDGMILITVLLGALLATMIAIGFDKGSIHSIGDLLQVIQPIGDLPHEIKCGFGFCGG